MGDLSSATTLGLTSDLLWTAVLLAAPLIAATTIVALLVSVLQVVTQVQESSLTFVPKLAAAVVVLLVAGGWMLGVLGDFATRMIRGIPGYF